MINMRKLISIITPSYNYGHLIHRLLDSILQQTYSNIEMFVIDDGSTDNTKQVIEDYIKKFKKRGFTLNYIYQKNQKQAMALNNGLKLITGEYLIWPDADDWYANPNAFEIMATALDNTDNTISCCMSLAYMVDENFVVIGKTKHLNNTGYIFRDCLFANFIKFPVGFTMVKTNTLFNEIDNRTIYTENNYPGQNWQLLLPVLYNYKCININEHLYYNFRRALSDSRKKRPYEEQLKGSQMTCDMLIAILRRIKTMPDDERKKLIFEILTKYHFNELLIHFFEGKKKNVWYTYKQMKAKNMIIPRKAKIFYYFSYIHCYNFIYEKLSVCKKIILNGIGLRKC